MAHHDIVRKDTSKTKAVVSSAVSRATPFVTKDLLYTLVLALVAIGVVSLSSWFVSSDPFQKDEQEQKIIAALLERDVIVSEVRGEGSRAVVAYAYKGEPIPGLLKENEVLELRTESSFTESLGKDETGKGIYTTVSFARPSYTREGDGWHYIEYDQAPKHLFDRAQHRKAFGWRLLPTALAAESTIFAGAGDGQIATILQPAWSDARDSTSGVSVSTDTVVSTNAAVASGKVSGASISRVFLPFNTSSIPAGANVTSASLGVYATTTTSYPNDAYDYVTVVRTSQATHTTLADADYDNIGTTEGIAAGNRKEISTISLGSYVTFPLNATGISWIAKAGTASVCSATAGITCLGLRDGHDVQNSAPGTDLPSSYAVFSSSEAAGTSQDPYLSVTYSAAFAFWQFDIF